MKPTFILICTIAALAASCGNHTTEDETAKQKASVAAITWMQHNMEPEEAALYRPGPTTITEKFYISPTSYDDMNLYNMEKEMERLSRTLFEQDFENEFQVEDAALRIDSARTAIKEYKDKNKKDAGWVLQHCFAIGDSLYVTFLAADKNLEKIYGEIPDPEAMRKTKALINAQLK